MKYFVSYTTQDKEVTMEILRDFAERLRKLGDVFVDIIDNNSEDKQARVFFELDKSDILILLESQSSYKSRWVSIELERARSRQIPVIKISLSELPTISEIEISVRLGYSSRPSIHCYAIRPNLPQDDLFDA